MFTVEIGTLDTNGQTEPTHCFVDCDEATAQQIALELRDQFHDHNVPLFTSSYDVSTGTCFLIAKDTGVGRMYLAVNRQPA